MGGKFKPCIYYCDIGLGFGSNVGAEENNLLKAINTVRDEISDITITGVSSVYLSSPVENINQPYFLNCAVIFRLFKPYRQFPVSNYDYFGKQFLFTLKDIEKNMGRKTGGKRYMPRIIDIDMLFIYDGASKKFITLDLPELTLPHSGIFNRKFVLFPLLDLSDYLKKPFDGESIKKALAKIENSDAGASQKISYYGKFDENLAQILR